MAIDHTGSIAWTGLAKPWNVPVRPPFGINRVKRSRDLLLFSCVTLTKLINRTSIYFIYHRLDPSRLWCKKI